MLFVSAVHDSGDRNLLFVSLSEDLAQNDSVPCNSELRGVGSVLNMVSLFSTYAGLPVNLWELVHYVQGESNGPTVCTLHPYEREHNICVDCP